MISPHSISTSRARWGPWFKMGSRGHDPESLHRAADPHDHSVPRRQLVYRRSSVWMAAARLNDAPIFGFSFTSIDGGATWTQVPNFNFRFSLVTSLPVGGP